MPERHGHWRCVGCIAGQCAEPLWGAPWPRGWVYDRYLDIGGLCD